MAKRMPVSAVSGGLDGSSAKPQKRTSPGVAGTNDTRERIKRVASEHYVLYGNDAFGFGEIAEAIAFAIQPVFGANAFYLAPRGVLMVGRRRMVH